MGLDKLYSIPEAAKLLGGISTWTVQSWLSAGRLRRTKVGRRTMISESELKRFLRESNAAHAEHAKTVTEFITEHDLAPQMNDVSHAHEG